MREAARKVFPIVFLGVIPIVVTLTALWIAWRSHIVSIDYHNEVYRQGRDVLQWSNPYPSPDADLSSGANAIWPIAAVLCVIPLALFSPGAADWSMALIELACLGAALRIMGVRDWRVYGASLLWPPVINATQTGNATLPLAVLCALAWRYRSARYTPGFAIGVGLAIKFFIWPLVIWLVALRRYRAAALATLIGASSLLLIVPFYSIHDYVDLLRNLSREFDEDSYTLYGLLVESGAPTQLARIVWIGVGLATLILAWRRKSFALAIGAALLLTPIAWLHFFALMLVPLAVVRPTFGAVWLIPLPTWFVPGTLNGRVWQNALMLCTFGALLVVCARAENASTLDGPTTVRAGTSSPDAE